MEENVFELLDYVKKDNLKVGASLRNWYWLL